ncbi:hypothetical protein KKC59_03520 [bacterium]|nr:hypothetical protein [bacterium]
MIGKSIRESKILSKSFPLFCFNVFRLIISPDNCAGEFFKEYFDHFMFCAYKMDVVFNKIINDSKYFMWFIVFFYWGIIKGYFVPCFKFTCRACRSCRFYGDFLIYFFESLFLSPA